MPIGLEFVVRLQVTRGCTGVRLRFKCGETQIKIELLSDCRYMIKS